MAEQTSGDLHTDATKSQPGPQGMQNDGLLVFVRGLLYPHLSPHMNRGQNYPLRRTLQNAYIIPLHEVLTMAEISIMKSDNPSWKVACAFSRFRAGPSRLLCCRPLRTKLSRPPSRSTSRAPHSDLQWAVWGLFNVRPQML